MENRRQFLKKGLLTGVGCIGLPGILRCRSLYQRRLNLYHIHTGEIFKEVVWEAGQYDPGALKRLHYFLRDWRHNHTKEISLKLIDLLYNIIHVSGTQAPVNIICGYRSPSTNQLLRKKGHRVAKASRHLTGHAIDFNIPKYSLQKTRQIACSFQAGGVGYYPKSGFLHVDIRDKLAYW